MAEPYILTAQEVADEVNKANLERKVSAKSVTRYADSGWLKHRRLADGTRLFTKAAAPRVLELRAARVPAMRRA